MQAWDVETREQRRETALSSMTLGRATVLEQKQRVLRKSGTLTASPIVGKTKAPEARVAISYTCQELRSP